MSPSPLTSHTPLPPSQSESNATLLNDKSPNLSQPASTRPPIGGDATTQEDKDPQRSPSEQASTIQGHQSLHPQPGPSNSASSSSPNGSGSGIKKTEGGVLDPLASEILSLLHGDGEEELESEDELDDYGEDEIDVDDRPRPPPSRPAPASLKVRPPKPVTAHTHANGRGDMGPHGLRGKVPRIFQACDYCKRRKQRCDGVKPVCGACQKRKYECTYANERKFRGPSKANRVDHKWTEARTDNNSRSSSPPQGTASMQPSLSSVSSASMVSNVSTHSSGDKYLKVRLTMKNHAPRGGDDSDAKSRGTPDGRSTPYSYSTSSRSMTPAQPASQPATDSDPRSKVWEEEEVEEGFTARLVPITNVPSSPSPVAKDAPVPTPTPAGQGVMQWFQS